MGIAILLFLGGALHLAISAARIIAGEYVEYHFWLGVVLVIVARMYLREGKTKQ